MLNDGNIKYPLDLENSEITTKKSEVDARLRHQTMHSIKHEERKVEEYPPTQVEIIGSHHR